MLSYDEREQLREAGLALGFARVGFTDAAPLAPDSAQLGRWLAQGCAGEMDYLVREGTRRTDPGAFLPGARSVIVLAAGLERCAPSRIDVPIAHYACRPDYHVVLHAALEQFTETLRAIAGPALVARASVDSAPLAERGLAARAGVAFIGKSTMAIVPGLGSHVLLAAVVTNMAIEADAPMATKCGDCRRCLDTCPTGAFPVPYQVDSRRCLSYLTIEHATEIPKEFREVTGRRVFGCDVCQGVCPHNHGHTRALPFPGLAPRADLLCETPPLAWLTLTARQHKRLVRQTPLVRFYRHQWARNTAIALANAGNTDAIEPLAELLSCHPEVLVRRHVAWALGRLSPGHAALAHAARHDPDSTVQQEANDALDTGR